MNAQASTDCENGQAKVEYKSVAKVTVLSIFSVLTCEKRNHDERNEA